MPIAYAHGRYWNVVFARAGSAFPAVFKRSVYFCIFAASAVVLHWFFPECVQGFGGTVLSPFQIMVAFIVGFRLNKSFSKYELANEAVLDMHADTRKILRRLMAYCVQGNAEVDETLNEIRRLLVLTCVLIKKHVRVERSFDEELLRGLIKPDELKQLTNVVSTEATHPLGDGKADKYPSRNRPSYTASLVQTKIMQLFRDGHMPSVPPPSVGTLDTLLDHLSDTLERIELLGLTIAPLPYAQVTRWINVAFLMFLPLDIIAKSWGGSASFREQNPDEEDWMCLRVQTYVLTIVLSFFANVMYFAIDEVATELEAPFGRDENDVDFEKMLRRIDKHTAAQLSLRLGRPVANFDLFPEYRKTDNKNREIKDGVARNSVQTLYAEKSEKPKGPIARWFSNNFNASAVVEGNGNEFFVEQETRIIEEQERESLMRLKEEMSKATRTTWKAAVRVAREHSKAGLEISSAPPSGSQLAAVATQVHLAIQEQRSLREESVTIQRKASLTPSSPKQPSKQSINGAGAAGSGSSGHREHDGVDTSEKALSKGSLSTGGFLPGVSG